MRNTPTISLRPAPGACLGGPCAPRSRLLIPAALLAVMAGGPAFAQAPAAGAARGHAAPLPQAHAFRLSGTMAGDLDLSAVRIAGSHADETPLLADVDLRSLDVAGRAHFEAFGKGRARRVEVLPQTFALELEDAGGGVTLLLHYRRAPAVFGFAALARDGTMRALIERNGIGGGQSLDPFQSVVGVSPDGRVVAVASAGYSGGIDGLADAWLLAASGPAFPNGTFVHDLTGTQPAEVDGWSFTNHGGMLHAVVNESLARAPWNGGATFSPVAIPGSTAQAPFQVVEEFATSADGTTMAFLAGTSRTLVDLFVLDANGTITNVTQSPAEIQEPNHAPNDDPDPGDWLALSADGSQVAFLREIAGGHEMYVRATAPSAPEQHLTPDLYFEHSIDAMSGILFRSGGPQPGPVQFFARGGAAGADLYLDAGGGGVPALTNLTATSGVSTPFFTNTATLDVASATRLGEVALIVDDRTAAGGGFDLWYTPPKGQAYRVAAGLTAEPRLEPLPDGGALVLVRGAFGFAVLRVAPQGAAPLLVLHFPVDLGIEAFAVSPDGATCAFAAPLGGGLAHVVALDVASGKPALAGPALPGARDVSFTATGMLLFTAGVPGAEQPYVVPPPYSTPAKNGAAQAASTWVW